MDLKENIPNELKELVLWKLKAEVPPNFRLSIGKDVLTKSEMKKHIEAEDEIGRTYIQTQLRFMRDLFNGKLTKALAE